MCVALDMATVNRLNLFQLATSMIKNFSNVELVLNLDVVLCPRVL